MLTPEDLLARQAQFWRAQKAGAFVGMVDPELLYAFRPGAPFYGMDRYFCRLVDKARLTIPADEAFRPETLFTASGWIFLEEPAPLPQNFPDRPPRRLQAVGWYTGSEGSEGPGVQVVALSEQTGCGLGRSGAVWGLPPGRTVGQQMTQMAAAGWDRYLAANDPRHECRWFHTAVNLMANKLTRVVTAPFTRSVLRRAAREGSALPDAFRRITLRRVEAARLQAGAAGQARDWQWQWHVRGHWRHYRTGHVVYVESYIKGPVGKPLKPLQTPFFQVNR